MGKPLSVKNDERYKKVKKELVEKCKSNLELNSDEWFEIERN